MKFFKVVPGYQKWNPIHWLAFGFGSGFLRPAPGTWGTLAAVPVWWALSHSSFPEYAVLTTVLLLAGWPTCWFANRSVTRAGGKADDSSIVFDEWAGYFVTMLFLPWTWQGAVVGFVFFRIFDAVKKGPVGWIDTKLKSGFDIMADDVVAGILAGLSCWILFWTFPDQVSWLYRQITSLF